MCTPRANSASDRNTCTCSDAGEQNVNDVGVACGHPHRLGSLEPCCSDEAEREGGPPATTSEHAHKENSHGHKRQRCPHPEPAIAARGDYECETRQCGKVERCARSYYKSRSEHSVILTSASLC